MFIQDMHGDMINISEFRSIEIEYAKRGALAGHHIVGRRTFDRDKSTPVRKFTEILGIYHFRKQAETVYEDLMKATANSEAFRLPDPVKLIEEATAETIKELQEYEEQWLKEGDVKPATGTGCLFVIGVFIAGIVCSLL